MAQHARKASANGMDKPSSSAEKASSSTDKASSGPDSASITNDASSSDVDDAHKAFDVFAASEVFWAPYFALSEALLQTQRNAADCLKLNRRLLDATRYVIRRQQDLALEISGSVLEAMCKSATPASGRPFDPSEVKGMFDRAVITGMNELSRVWMDRTAPQAQTVEKAGEAPVQVAEAA